MNNAEISFERNKMGDFFDDLNSDEQLIRNNEIMDNMPKTIKVCKSNGNVQVQSMSSDGFDIDTLYSGRDQAKIQDAINEHLKSYPESFIEWESPGITGIVFRLRFDDGKRQAWFRTDTKGAFARRKVYASQNTGSTVSFSIL